MKPIDPELFAAQAEQLKAHLAVQDTIYSRLQPHIEACDAETPSITVSFPILPWELNGNGMANGGITATMLDAVMGTLSYSLSGGFTPTVSLNISYLRPVPGEGTVVVRAEATMVGRTVICISGALWDQRNPARLLATAQGVFRNLAPAE